MKFCNQSSVFRIKASDLHQTKGSEQLFGVVESGVSSMFSLADAGFQSTKLGPEMRASDGASQRGSQRIPRAAKNGEDQLQGRMSYMKKFTM